jgi:hypothetical protein
MQNKIILGKNDFLIRLMHTITTSEEDKLMLLSNKTSYKILEKDFSTVHDDIKILQNYLKKNGGKKKRNHFLQKKVFSRRNSI